MTFSTLWTIVIVSALLFFMRHQGRVPVVIGIVMASLVLVVGTLGFINAPTRAHYADFTLGAALDTLFLAGLIWLAFVKNPKHRPQPRERTND